MNKFQHLSLTVGFLGLAVMAAYPPYTRTVTTIMDNMGPPTINMPSSNCMPPTGAFLVTADQDYGCDWVWASDDSYLTTNVAKATFHINVRKLCVQAAAWSFFVACLIAFGGLVEFNINRRLEHASHPQT